MEAYGERKKGTKKIALYEKGYQENPRKDKGSR
ncbi:uncharacterized protein METZ01_LOCUS508321, partial [marine metagenome]